MNEQQLADLFSEQLDRLLAGEAIDLPAEAGDLPELLEIIGQPTTQTHFQASSAVQAAFQSQLVGWFGLANGGTPMAILGLSKIWLISIVIAVITVITGAGIIAVITTSIFISRSGPVVYVPTKTPTAQGTLTVTASPVASTTVTPAGTPTVISTPVPTAVITGTPSLTPVVGLPPLVFVGTWQIPRLCAGVYTTQSSLVNVGNAPINNAALAWEVIEGAELVDTVGFNSANLTTVGDDSAATGADDTAIAARSDPLVGAVDFQPISFEQKVKLDVKVKVKEDWWKHGSKTEIKIKLSVKNKFDLQPHPDPASYSQIITIVRQDAQWVTLTGFPHNVGENKMLVDGRIVVTNNCTGLPTNWPPGSKIRVVGWLQPDGTFIAINIIVININIITGDFDSGVPLPGGGGSSGGDGGSRGGGGGGGGSKGGSGGSGGSKGGSK
ncbi:MAG: hypothetical protein HS126_33015 [Anaerolineales bacterium]|nr:hypothetical protein [Anaerolineales bacterium]